jgi:hypothetical protein
MLLVLLVFPPEGRSNLLSKELTTKETKNKEINNKHFGIINRLLPFDATENDAFKDYSQLSPPVSESLTNRGVLPSTLLQDILHPPHHLLNVLLQIANKLGLSNKKKLSRVALL